MIFGSRVCESVSSSSKGLSASVMFGNNGHNADILHPQRVRLLYFWMTPGWSENGWKVLSSNSYCILYYYKDFKGFFYRNAIEEPFFVPKRTFQWIFFLQTHCFCLLKTWIDGLEWCELLVDYCDVFISCLDSHSDGTHSLQSIYWWASDAMLHLSKSDKETNSSMSWMTRG